MNHSIILLVPGLLFLGLLHPVLFILACLISMFIVAIWLFCCIAETRFGQAIGRAFWWWEHRWENGGKRYVYTFVASLILWGWAYASVQSVMHSPPHTGLPLYAPGVAAPDPTPPPPTTSTFDLSVH
jgi:hypothetical protein